MTSIDRRALWNLPILLVGILQGGCLFDRISWSPDGRCVAFIGPNDRNLWLWDTQSKKAEKIQNGEIACCRYLPNGQGILYGLAPQVGKPERDSGKADLHLYNPATRGDVGLVNQIEPISFDVSPDSRLLYYVEETEEKEPYVLRSLALQGGEKGDILSSSANLIYLKVDPTGARALVASESETLNLIELARGNSRILLERAVYQPNWLDPDRIVYISPQIAGGETQKRNDVEVGTLVVHDLTTSSTRELLQDVPVYFPPSVSQGGSSVVVSAFTKSTWGENWQVFRVDPADGHVEVLTDEPFGTGLAAQDPSEGRVAYFTPDFDKQEMAVLRILDRETAEASVAWRDEEERLISAAESLLKTGERSQAEATYLDLLARYPESRLLDVAHFGLILLCLEPPLLDLDQAFGLYGKLRTGELRKEVRPLYWRSRDRMATDPPVDWMRTFGTEDSRQTYEFNTDLTRDLLGLWARWSDDRLYLRIDYNSPQDVTGLTFEDTILLFNVDPNSSANRQIRRGVEWDRGIDRMVIFRHWYENQRQSQYDVEIRNGEGETVSHFQASGFVNPQYPDLEVIDLMADWERQVGSLAISLSREALGLKEDREASIQVCTTKGGIESLKGKELSTELESDTPGACPIADAFGEENTAGRVETDLSSGGPPVVRGVAGVLDLDRVK